MKKGGPILIVVGASLAIIGSMLPWMSVVTVFGSISATGTEGDGIVTLGFGVACLVVGLVALISNSPSKGMAVMATLAATVSGIIIAVIVGVDHQSIASSGDELGGFGIGQVGVGIWTMYVAAVVMFVGSALLILERRRSANH